MPLQPMPYSVRAFAGGDLGDAQALTRALTALRDAEKDPARRAALDAVLSGRSTLRELVRAPAGQAIIASGARVLGEEWDATSEAEREDQVARAREQQRRWREEIDALPERLRTRILPDAPSS